MDNVTFKFILSEGANTGSWLEENRMALESLSPRFTMLSFQLQVLAIVLFGLRLSIGTVPKIIGEPLDGIMSGSFDEFATLVTSPECWRDAARAMNLDAFNSDVCHLMTSEDQKLLAIELARCHLLDLGRPLFDDTEICSRDSYQNNLSDCLKHLSTAGETAYTHLRTSIYQLCAQLRQEVTMIDYQQLSSQLARTSAATGKHLEEMLKEQEQLRDIWKEREKESISRYDELKKTIEKDRLQWKNESSNMWSQVQGEKELFLKREYDLQRQMFKEMTEQQENLIRQSRELDQFRHTIFAPWFFSFESVYACFRYVNQIMHWLLWIIGSTLMARLLTIPASVRWLRPYVTALFFFAGIFEQITANGWSPTTVEDPNDLNGVFLFLLIIAGMGTLVYGVLATCCCRNKQEQEQNNGQSDGANVWALEKDLLQEWKEIRRLREQLQAELYSNMACRSNVNTDEMGYDRRPIHPHGNSPFTNLPLSANTVLTRQANCASQSSIPSNIHSAYMGQSRANVPENLGGKPHFYDCQPPYTIPFGLRNLGTNGSPYLPADLLVRQEQVSSFPRADDDDKKDHMMHASQSASETGEISSGLPCIGSTQASLKDTSWKKKKRSHDCMEDLEEKTDFSKRQKVCPAERNTDEKDEFEGEQFI